MKHIRVLLVATLLGFPFGTRAGEFPEVLVNKMLMASGRCLFKDELFQAFVTTIIAPKGLFTLVPCVLFTQGRSLNPAWLALIDEKGDVEKVIKWTSPAKFETVYTASEGDI